MIQESPTEAPEVASGTREHLFLWPPLILSVVLFWIVPMFNGLWIDEAGNWWVLKDGFRTMLERSQFWLGGPSVLFNTLVIAAMSVGGASDFVMRIPALLAALATLLVIYRLGVLWADQTAAMCACLVFVTLNDVFRLATVVRPYSLGLLLLTGAVLALVRWLDTGNWRYGAAYVVLASLTLYAVITYALMYLVHALFVVRKFLDGECRVRARALIAASFCTVLLCLPLVPMTVYAYRTRGRMTFLGRPDAPSVLESVVPGLLVGSVGVALLIVVISRRKFSLVAGEPGLNVWLLGVWAMLPPVVLLVLALFTDVQMFTGRYYSENAPAIALLGGILISRIRPLSARSLTASVILVIALWFYGYDERFLPYTCDVRGAVAAMRGAEVSRQTPVLVSSFFVEGWRLPGVRDGSLMGVMLSPLRRYDAPGHLILIPAVVDDESEDFLGEIVESSLRDQGRFFLLGFPQTNIWRAWLDARCRPLGFSSKTVGTFGNVVVYEFDRAAGK
jgi:hypothetical protein